MQTEKQRTGTGNPTRNRGTSRQVGARAGWRAAACLLALASSLYLAQAATYVCGYVSGTWAKANSPYILTCDVLAGDLTIQAGVTVSASNFTFEVAGVLLAQGTEAEPIVFNARNPAVGWQGIFFNYSTPGSEMHYCIISNAVNSGIRIASSQPAITHCLIANNASASGSGGGVSASNVGGDLVIEYCTITNNSAPAGHGGGIYVNTVQQGDLILRYCTIANNTARYYGGGIWAGMSTNTLVLEYCQILGNVADPGNTAGDYYGGGLGVIGSLRMRNCLVATNSIYGYATDWTVHYAYGGGLYSEGRTEINNCTFRSNYAREWRNGYYSTAYAYGGGMMASGAGPLTIVNSVLSDNACSGDSGSYGGALFINSGVASPSVINCTFAYNNIEGLYSSASSAAIMNSILFFNYGGGTQITGTTNVTYCDVQNGFVGQGNINFQPIFQSLTNLMIALGSPCIDAGNPAPVYNDVCLAPCGPSLGTVRDDMGAYGGPGACGWTSPCTPSIAAQPQDQVGCLSHSATFTVGATGAGSLSYQWYFNTDTRIVNATNASLTLRNLQGTNAGNYSVVVSSPYGSVTSTVAQLTVYEAYTSVQVHWYFNSYMYAGLNIAGQPGATYVLKYTTDLRNTNWDTWTPLATNTMGSADWFYLDEESPYSRMRFYGAKLKP